MHDTHATCRGVMYDPIRMKVRMQNRFYRRMIRTPNSHRGTTHNGRACCHGTAEELTSFGVGDDAIALFKLLARQERRLEKRALTSRSIQLNSVLSRSAASRSPTARRWSPESSVIPSIRARRGIRRIRAKAAWVGRYQKPAQDVTFTVRGLAYGASLIVFAKASLPP